MSGTSLDGLDLAYCLFINDEGWSVTIEEATTIPYSEEWKSKLRKLPEAIAEELTKTHVEFGHYIGQQTKLFIDGLNIEPEIIASHGHTVFHQPERGFTTQIGDGNAIAATLGLPVIFDFRSLDVALGGQGAPLVPIGDRLLFGDFDFCLNLGGIANISYEENYKRIAYDICTVNMILNYLSEEAGLSFDDKGKLASSGSLDLDLKNSLDNFKYYKTKGVKTLGREWFENTMLPEFAKFKSSIEDKLRTAVEHIAQQVSLQVNDKPGQKMLITGGGAHNDFLISRIKDLTNVEIVLPDKTMIDYKEAMIFAFLGVLRVRNEINCLSSVTGASHDSSCGTIV